MDTVRTSRTEYKKLKQYSSAYLRVAQEMAKAKSAYPYDYEYISSLSKKALTDYKNGKFIEAESIDDALVKANKRCLK